MKRIYICFPEGKNKVFTLSYEDTKTWTNNEFELTLGFKTK